MGGRRGCTSGGSSWKGHGCASRQSHGRSVSLLFAAYSCPLCWERWEWSVMGASWKRGRKGPSCFLVFAGACTLAACMRAHPCALCIPGEYEPVAGGRVRVRPAMHHDAVKDFDNKYEERTWSAAKDSVIQRAEEAFVQHESPRAVHDCGLDGDDCNFSGTGPDDHDLGSYMKASTQSLAELGRGSWQQRGDAAVSTGERASALAAQQPDAQMQQLWNAARNDASLRSTRERLGLASSARDASEEVARGAAADAVAVAAAGQDYAGNMDQYLSSKAPTQDLSEGGLYNPHKNGYGAAAEWGKVVARLSQQRRQQQQQPPPRAQARSGQGVPSHLVQLAESSANTPAAPAVETVELSHSDIDELAKELYKEASAADRKAASSAASARQTHIRTAVAQAIGRRAPASARPQRGVWRPLARVDRVGLPAAGLVGVGEEPVKVQRGMVGRARALHAAHRAMVWGAGAGAGVAGRVWRMRRQQRAMGPTGSAGTVVGQMVAPWQQQREQQALMGSGRMPWSAVPVATESEEEPEVVEGDGETEVAEGGSEEGDMAEADGKHEGRDEGREIEGDPAARDQDEVEAADGEDEESEGQSKEQSDDAEEAPVTYLAGACCDSEGNCKSCPGPDEDYNMWDNLYIFPGDQAGMGRSFTHVLLAILLIIMGVFVASVLLDKRKEETGEHPIDSMYQNAKDLSETVGSSAGNLWRSTVASVSGSKEVCALL